MPSDGGGAAVRLLAGPQEEPGQEEEDGDAGPCGPGLRRVIGQAVERSSDSGAYRIEGAVLDDCLGNDHEGTLARRPGPHPEPAPGISTLSGGPGPPSSQYPRAMPSFRLSEAPSSAPLAGSIMMAWPP